MRKAQIRGILNDAENGFDVMTDYLPLITQITTTLLTIVATLGGIYLAQHLSGKSEERKRAEEEKDKLFETKKYAYLDFLDTFTNLIYDSGFRNEADVERLNIISTAYLNAAIRVAEFEDTALLEPRLFTINETTYEIQSLREFISVIMRVKYSASNQYMYKVKRFGYENFCPIILSFLLSIPENMDSN